MKYSNKKYGDYREYLEHQPKKARLSHVRKRLIRKRKGRVAWFQKQFSTLPKVSGKVLCLGARFGEEVEAFRNLGYNAVGVDLEEYPPFVIKDDMNKLSCFAADSIEMIYSNAFDHCWEPAMFAKTIKRVLKNNGYVVIHTNLGNPGDYEVQVPDDPKEIIDLFKSWRLILSAPLVPAFHGMVHNIVLQKTKSKIIGFLPTVRWRQKDIGRVVQRLWPQFDELHIYCGDCDFAPKQPRVRIHRGPNIGVRARWAIPIEGPAYIFGVDDDILYPTNYTKKMIEFLKTHNNSIVAGVHGRIFNSEMPQDYFADARIIHFKQQSNTLPVHCVGTGTCAYHSDLLQLTDTDFCEPNMGDLILGMICQERGIPRYIIEREDQWLKHAIGDDPQSIWNQREKHTVRRNALLQSIRWPLET